MIAVLVGGLCGDTITEERREVYPLTLLSPWLTLDYDDGCIFSFGGWHYFSSVVFY